MRILVVEDDPRIAHDVIETLTGAGYVVDHDGDGEEAWFRGDTQGALRPRWTESLFRTGRIGRVRISSGCGKSGLVGRKTAAGRQRVGMAGRDPRGLFGLFLRTVPAAVGSFLLRFSVEANRDRFCVSDRQTRRTNRKPAAAARDAPVRT